MAKQKGFISKRPSRFFKITGLTTRVSSSYTGQRIKEVFQRSGVVADARMEAHIRNAERIVKTLGELKGAAMKVGQAVSTHADILPKEFADILATLQKAAPPMAYEVIAEQIASEFGKAPEALFAHIEEEPYASASIGQVHRARLANGTEVVVKVQYPGVEENIEGDMKNLRSIFSMGSLFGYKRRDLDEMFNEIQARLSEELDYEQEMENIKTFRRLFRRDKRILIPKSFPPYCSRRVLTMEFLPGDPMEALFSHPYTQEDRDHFGSLIFDIYAHQVLGVGLLHADPHPGNYAFRKDGRLVLYDFGCLKAIPPEIQKTFRNLTVCALEGRYEQIDEALYRLGARDPRKKAPDADFYRRFVEVYTRPFQSGEVYDFGTAALHERLFELAPLGLSKMLHFKPSPETVFISRVIGGHYGNLKHMGARACWRDILEPYLEEKAGG